MTKTGKGRILYVEDDPDYREAVRAILEAAGYEVVEAVSAEEGLAAFRESAPDAALVDLMMEEVDAGVTLTKELRAAGAAIPVFLLSSVGDALSLERAPRSSAWPPSCRRPSGRKRSWASSARGSADGRGGPRARP